jgi:hypothetical protein
MAMIDVRDAVPSDRSAWRRMWAAYCAHLVSAAPSRQEHLGFAHDVLHPHTFTSRTACYLEDLALIDRGRECRWRQIEWHTETDDESARRLYDRVAALTEYVRYDVTLP